MSKGIVIFAHNNRQIDYGKIALANACTIKDSMSNNNITLITDDGTANWLYKEYNKELPISLYGPDRGASKPTLSVLLFSSPNRLELNKNII